MRGTYLNGMKERRDIFHPPTLVNLRPWQLQRENELHARFIAALTKIREKREEPAAAEDHAQARNRIRCPRARAYPPRPSWGGGCACALCGTTEEGMAGTTWSSSQTSIDPLKSPVEHTASAKTTWSPCRGTPSLVPSSKTTWSKNVLATGEWHYAGPFLISLYTLPFHLFLIQQSPSIRWDLYIIHHLTTRGVRSMAK